MHTALSVLISLIPINLILYLLCIVLGIYLCSHIPPVPPQNRETSELVGRGVFKKPSLVPPYFLMRSLLQNNKKIPLFETGRCLFHSAARLFWPENVYMVQNRENDGSQMGVGGSGLTGKIGISPSCQSWPWLAFSFFLPNNVCQEMQNTLT